MGLKNKNDAAIKRVLSLCLFAIIMLLYMGIQLYWGVNLYRAFVNEEKKELGDLLSSVITSYASTTLSSEANDPDHPVFTMERFDAAEADSVASNAVVTEVIKEPETLIRSLENSIIIASIKTDSLFMEKLAPSLDKKLTDRRVSSFDIYFAANGLPTKTISTKLNDKPQSLYPIEIVVEKEIRAGGDEYVIGTNFKTLVPESLKTLVILFVAGFLLLLVILYLLIKMSRRIEAEKAINRQQELFFFGLVHDVKLPLSLAHSLINGLTGDTSISKKVNAGLIEADNHILKLTEDINMLLMMNRLKQNQSSESRQIYLYDIVQDICTELEAHYPEKELALETDFPDDLSLIFPAEELTLVLRVFIDNAVKYNEASPKVTIGATTDGTTISIWVADNGLGIKSLNEKHTHKLTQVSIRQICKESNGGIGLMAAWTIVHSKGGKIIYGKNHPKGTIFKITLPTQK